jgi:hypothetical protein
MSWNIKWCKGRKVSPDEIADSEEEVLAKVREAMRLNASNLHLTRTLESGESNPEYHNIAPAFCQRRIIPFLGAGASVSVRKTGAPWSPDAPFPPTAAELAHWLAQACGLPAWFLSDTHNLSRVASYYVLTSYVPNIPRTLRAQRLALLQKLAAVFARAKQPGPVHNFLAKHAMWLPVIVTTNYDMLMEEAFIQAKQPFNKIVHLADQEWANSLHIQEYRWNEQDQKVSPVQDTPLRLELDRLQRELASSDFPLLYKMHGSVDSGAFVITEEDYVEFLSAIAPTSSSIVPQALLRYFEQHSFLFLGYSLEDWNFRVILQNLKVENPWQESESGNGKDSDVRSSSKTKIGGVGIGRKFDTLPNAVSKMDSAKARGGKADARDDQEARRHWAVQLGATKVDTAVWQSRHVEIHDMDLNVFVAELEEEIRQLLPAEPQLGGGQLPSSGR